MAITKTMFQGTTLDANQAEVYEWLTANATDYFDGFTNDTENYKIYCTVNGETAMEFDFSGIVHSRVQARLYLNGVVEGTGSTYDAYSNGSTMVRFVYTTSNGIFFMIDRVDATANYGTNNAWIGVFKTTADTVGGVYVRYINNTNNFRLTLVDFELNTTFFAPYAPAVDSIVVKPSQGASSLTPLPLGDGGTGAVGVFLVLFISENLYQADVNYMSLVIDIGGTKYLTNGILAFEE